MTFTDYVIDILLNIKNIAVIHGEESQAVPFGETLKKARPGAKVIVPVYREKLEI